MKESAINEIPIVTKPALASYFFSTIDARYIIVVEKNTVAL